MSLPIPTFITEEHLLYLDDLRDSGVTNMFGAAPYLEREFGIPVHEARNILSYWMQTYAERHSLQVIENKGNKNS